MDRREFLKVSAAATLSGAGVSQLPGSTVKAAAAEPRPTRTPAILSAYTASEHRQRLENIAVCERTIRRCMREHLITDYLPGQVVYNLGEYPCRKPYDPDDWDEQELDKLKEHGIGLIHLHSEWMDWERLYGADTFTPLNPAGFQRFVEMVHKRGMKVIVYVSSGFIERRDPDFREEWARDQDLVEIFYRLARCSPASPGWRSYLLPRLIRILEDYGVDGLYNDAGYIKLAGNKRPPTKDEVPAFEESDAHDGAEADLLALIYGEVKRRGGILKLHFSDVRRPQTELKVYDYLWVGETVGSIDQLREATKNHPPYVVPCLDMSRARIENENELYLNSIPYMQFPVLLAGRPLTGERATIPGIEYREDDFWTQHLRKIWKYYQANPNGPHSYGWWDSVPGRPQARPVHAHWLKRYLPMVEEGTWAWLEIGESSLFGKPLPPDVVASAFANRQLYLVLANYGHSPVEVSTAQAYVPVDSLSGDGQRQWRLDGRSLGILQFADARG